VEKDFFMGQSLGESNTWESYLEWALGCARSFGTVKYLRAIAETDCHLDGLF
jgi:hypothetical protein